MPTVRGTYVAVRGPRVIWPTMCVGCCGAASAQRHLIHVGIGISHKGFFSMPHPGDVVSTSISWDIPACEPCYRWHLSGRALSRPLAVLSIVGFVLGFAGGGAYALSLGE